MFNSIWQLRATDEGLQSCPVLVDVPHGEQQPAAGALLSMYLNDYSPCLAWFVSVDHH